MSCFSTGAFKINKNLLTKGLHIFTFVQFQQLQPLEEDAKSLFLVNFEIGTLCINHGNYAVEDSIVHFKIPILATYCFKDCFK